MSDTCWYCGGVIVFRYHDGMLRPIHLSGACPMADGGWVGFAQSTSYHEDFCRPTVCQYCGADIFFVRHNGGSVWFDELGWPWPKHPCYYPEDRPLQHARTLLHWRILTPQSDLCLVVFAEQLSRTRTQLAVLRHSGISERIEVLGNGVPFVGELVTFSQDGTHIVCLADPTRKLMLADVFDRY